MTEEEAKTKWCPFANSYYLRGNRGTTGEQNPEQCRCIGSACMVWRWDEPGNAPVGPRDPNAFCEPNDNGHCGLAGKP